MTAEWTWWALPGIGVGLLQIALGLVVFLARTSRAQNRWLAVMLVAGGISNLTGLGLRLLLTEPHHAGAAMRVFVSAGFVSVLALVGFYTTFPLPALKVLPQKLVTAFGALAGGVMVATTFLWPSLSFVGMRNVRGATWLSVDGVGPLWFASLLFILAIPLAGLLLAWAGARKAVTATSRRKHRIIATAFGFHAILMAASLALVGLVVPSSRAPSANDLLVVILLQVAAAGLLVILLSYGILRTQILGVDVKVRWTLRQSTVAAIFVAVFFVVSESAATFFSDQVGTYAGILAAGILIFGIAPIYRWAERLSERAIPLPRSGGGPDAGERVEIYRQQVESAWEDGALSPDERRMLEAARRSLRIDAETAMNVEAEVADRC